MTTTERMELEDLRERVARLEATLAVMNDTLAFALADIGRIVDEPDPQQRVVNYTTCSISYLAASDVARRTLNCAVTRDFRQDIAPDARSVVDEQVAKATRNIEASIERYAQLIWAARCKALAEATPQGSA